ncbi:hypothetical protein EWM64_g66 [Hericium alpestre]|uniref:DUF7704 domain-containing protein n=1 Tax=Hericium alpestre TaxID=135208 RepID=A0A4Z0ABI0_9AGAM|nr:hypothetical protein EWM64_g66 [Hericium alpestre]
MFASRSALPKLYYAIFGLYEPLLTTVGLLGTLVDPEKTHNQQAPWPKHSQPPHELPLASIVTIVQLAHVCAIVGLVNLFLLAAARKYLAAQPALQEKIVGALLTPLLIGDIAHLALTLWALGEHRWRFSEWSGMLWTTVLLGLTLMVPRMTWHMGIGRYMEKRDGKVL